MRPDLPGGGARSGGWNGGLAWRLSLYRQRVRVTRGGSLPTKFPEGTKKHPGELTGPPIVDTVRAYSFCYSRLRGMSAMQRGMEDFFHSLFHSALNQKS